MPTALRRLPEQSVRKRVRIAAQMPAPEMRNCGRPRRACEGMTMISKWSEWKRYPRVGKGENIEAPISPGIYEVRIAGSGALHSFGAVDNVAEALSQLPVASKSWFGRREPARLPELEYRTCATSSKADAKAAAEGMIGRRETYMSGAA